MAQGSGDPEARLNESSTSFKPYRSILNFPSTSTRENDEDAESTESTVKRKRLPPWRRAVGAAHFCHLLEDTLDDDENDLEYRKILERTFAGFSDEVVGSDIPVVDFRAEENDGGWAIDEHPEITDIQGERPVLYHLADDGPAKPVNTTRHARACWNCGGIDHELVDCPHRRDQAQIALARAHFNAQKESVPDHAMAHLWMYTFDEPKRTRRLALVDTFIPGRISHDLADAIFTPGEDMTADEMERMELERRRRRYPWLKWMMKWGYPPGWIAGRDPLVVLRERLEAMPIEELVLDDGEDQLEVYGGQMDTNMRSSASSGSSDMSLDESVSSTPPSPPPLMEYGPPATPPPPPPPDEPPPSVPMIRWARYETDLFDSDRLMAFTTARPLPLGF